MYYIYIYIYIAYVLCVHRITIYYSKCFLILSMIYYLHLCKIFNSMKNVIFTKILHLTLKKFYSTCTHSSRENNLIASGYTHVKLFECELFTYLFEVTGLQIDK